MHLHMQNYHHSHISDNIHNFHEIFMLQTHLFSLSFPRQQLIYFLSLWISLHFPENFILIGSYKVYIFVCFFFFNQYNYLEIQLFAIVNYQQLISFYCQVIFQDIARPQFIYSSTAGNLGCFQVLAITNKVFVCIYTFISSEQTPRVVWLHNMVDDV